MKILNKVDRHSGRRYKVDVGIPNFLIKLSSIYLLSLNAFKEYFFWQTDKPFFAFCLCASAPFYLYACYIKNITLLKNASEKIFSSRKSSRSQLTTFQCFTTNICSWFYPLLPVWIALVRFWYLQLPEQRIWVFSGQTFRYSINFLIILPLVLQRNNFVYAMFKDYKRNSLEAMAEAVHIDYQKFQYFFCDSKWDLPALKQKRMDIIQRQRTTALTKEPPQ